MGDFAPAERRGAGRSADRLAHTERIVMRVLAIVMILLPACGMAHAVEIDALISTAIKAATDELLPPFERANGHTIRASYGPSGALIRRFDNGESADLFLTDSKAIASSSSKRARLFPAAPTLRAQASALPCARARRGPTCRPPNLSSMRCWQPKA